MIKDTKVVALQARVPFNKNEGEAQIKRLVSEAIREPVDIVGLPEDCVAPLKDVIAGYDPLKFLSQIAKENNVYLFGANAVKETDGKIFNSAFFLNREGKLLARHNKVVLTPPEAEDGLVPGNSLEIIDTEFGKIALIVCKDSFNRYAAWFFDKFHQQNVDIVLVPSYSINNRPSRAIEMWVSGLKALSIWFDLYIIAPGTIGKNTTQWESFGNALILSPDKVTLARGSNDKEEILRATLRKDELEDLRNTYGSKWQPKTPPEVEVKTIQK